MYSEKIEDILNDLENKELEIAGGSVVGIVLSTVNSLIKYIANLTIGKKNYMDVQDRVQELDNLKQKSLNSIDKDKEILEKILNSYKQRKDYPQKYEEVCKEAVEFALQVIEISYKTLEISQEISKVGNKMLSSDFKICKYYATASVEASKENLFINLNSVKDEEYKNKINSKYQNMLLKYSNIS